uniref:Putative secreted protein n=1 Tax=Ixodes ricinus TaxID=34613 RepID=V5H7X8_IXORI
MKSVVLALIFTLFASCFATREVFQKYPKNINSGEKYITVAFVLADFENKDVNLGSNVGVWLSDSFEEAATILSTKLNVKI